MRNRLILFIAASSLAQPAFAADPIYQNWHALRGQAAPPVVAAVRLPTFKGPVKNTSDAGVIAVEKTGKFVGGVMHF